MFNKPLFNTLRKTPFLTKTFFFRSSASLAHSSVCQTALEHIARTLNLPNYPLQNTMVVAIQHCLGSTADMFQQFQKLGLKRAIIGEKSYSTHPPSVRKLVDMGYTVVNEPAQLGYGHFDDCIIKTVHDVWIAALTSLQKRPVETLIILDDGGDLISSTPAKLFNDISYKPKHVIGIEQTRREICHRFIEGVPFPVINVADSLIKTLLEYPIVANRISTKIIDELHGIFLTKNSVVGIIDSGTIGQSLAKKFLSEGYRVIIYDKVKRRTSREMLCAHNISALLRFSDIVISCTGTDIMSAQENLSTLLKRERPIVLVSASSKDIEYNSLLLHIQQETKQSNLLPHNPLETIKYFSISGAEINILRGGIPLNFEQLTTPEEVWPTNAALMAASLMGVTARSNGKMKESHQFMLDPVAQEAILQHYCELNPHSTPLKKIQNLPPSKLKELIISNSRGEPIEIFPQRTSYKSPKVSS